MRPQQWRTALLSLEVGWSSDAAGAGVEWATIAGFADAETLELLRAIERKLGRIVARA